MGYVIIRTSGSEPAAFVWRFQTLEAARQAAEKYSRDLNSEWVIAEVMGEVKRHTQWHPTVTGSPL